MQEEEEEEKDEEEECKQRRAGWHRAEIFLLSVTENLDFVV